MKELVDIKKAAQSLLQIFKLWLSAKRDRIVFYSKNKLLFISRNTSKIISLIFLYLFYKLNISWIEEFHLQNKKIETLLEDLSVHSIFTLVIFLLFQRKISELIGLGIGEKDKFYADDFFYKIRQSSSRMRILETFTKVILENENKNKLEQAIKRLVANAKINNNKCTIQILLLDPESDYAELRIKQLLKDEELANPNLIMEEKAKWHMWLQDWKTIKENIEKYASEQNAELSFTISIYDTSPSYSIYSCDDFAYVGPYREGVETTNVEQAVVNLTKPINHEYISTFNDLLDKNSTHTNSPTRPLSDYLKFPFNTKNLPAVKTFVSLAKLTDKAKIREILMNDLNPQKMSDTEIFGLIKYLEDNHYHKTSDRKHYNIFGTGGDKRKTINISTIAAIFASHFDPSIVINKYGTLEVSSNVGSETFFNKLRTILRTPNFPKSKYFNFNTENGSKYVHLITFGYEYTDEIRDVRKTLWEENKDLENPGYLDIFKIIFPISNLSGNSGQVNGVSNEQYKKIYEKIYEKFGKKGIIVFNEKNQIDEIMEGKNEIIIFSNDNSVKTEIFSFQEFIEGSEEYKKYWDYYGESNEKKHVDRFFSFFEQPDYVKKTMAYNVAVILKLEYQNKNIHSLAKEVLEWFDKIKIEIEKTAANKSMLAATGLDTAQHQQL